jgi:hypothetical protein
MIASYSLQILFNFIDADHDGFISETEWTIVLCDDDPFSNGIHTLELEKLPLDADAPMQAVESYKEAEKRKK